MMKFLFKIIVGVCLTMSVSQAQGEDLRITSGLISGRLEIRDPQGRIVATVEKTLMGKLVIKDTSGSVIKTLKPQSK